MENTPENNIPGSDPKPEQEPYIPRPAWQVWLARIGLVLFIGLVILQLIHVARGGM